MLKIGIEQEFVFADSTGRYLDADNTGYTVFSAIVDRFPAFEGDDAYFECKSLETYPKRCYVEGFEHHDAHGTIIETLPKGLEIRTLPHDSVAGLITEFRQYIRYGHETGSAYRYGSAAHQPSPVQDFNRAACAERGSGKPGANGTGTGAGDAGHADPRHACQCFIAGASTEKMQDLVEKINYYLPALIPWSFSSPFYHGEVFEGLCSRNYLRADSRRMADLYDRRGACVLEFRGFDACGDTALLAAVLGLYIGFLLDESLPGRSRQQDPELLKHSSLVGFGDPLLSDLGLQILRASQAAIANTGGGFNLLEAMLRNNDSYAARMKQKYAETGDIMESISGWYDF